MQCSDVQVFVCAMTRTSNALPEPGHSVVLLKLRQDVCNDGLVHRVLAPQKLAVVDRQAWHCGGLGLVCYCLDLVHANVHMLHVPKDLIVELVQWTMSGLMCPPSCRGVCHLQLDDHSRGM